VCALEIMVGEEHTDLASSIRLLHKHVFQDDQQYPGEGDCESNSRLTGT
jgi:hypothetical protein